MEKGELKLCSEKSAWSEMGRNKREKEKTANLAEKENIWWVVKKKRERKKEDL